MDSGLLKLDQGWRLDEGHRLDSLAVTPGQINLAGGITLNPMKGSKTMDYLTKKRSDRYRWWKNMLEKIGVGGPAVGLTTKEIDDIKDIASAQCASMEAADNADQEAKRAKKVEAAATAKNTPLIRLAVRNMKTRGNYAISGIEGLLDLKGAESTFDPLTFKTELTLSIVGDQVRVDFIKGECDSIAIYCRQRGSILWTRIGIDSDSPYYDTKPLAAAGVPEVREYMGRGMIDDEEIGIESDIVSIALK
jgi:hypothetical protein